MWIMIVSFLSLDVQLMHDEDQDVIEGSRGDIARIWYWQVVRVKIIDRKFGLFFLVPPKKNASEDSYPNFEPWPCVCVWKYRRPNCQWMATLREHMLIYNIVSNWGYLILKQSNMFIYFLPIPNNVTFPLGKSSKCTRLGSRSILHIWDAHSLLVWP